MALSDLLPEYDDANCNSELNDWLACEGLLCDNSKAHLILLQRSEVDLVPPTLSLARHLDSASKLDPQFFASGYLPLRDGPCLPQQLEPYL